jgi:hypothetical protein
MKRKKNRVAARCRRCSEVRIFGVERSFACFSICMHGMYFAKAALFSRAFWVPNLGSLVWVSFISGPFCYFITDHHDSRKALVFDCLLYKTMKFRFAQVAVLQRNVRT